MHLLRTSLSDEGFEDLVLEEFNGDRIPPYAILSHMWGKSEVLFSHIYDGGALSRYGFKKIQWALDQAKRDGYQYVWIDTCCIDKSSSAELSEAINSMYTWYQLAGKCYAYLEDVPSNVDVTHQDSAFAASRWFKRGWTLQELLAPKELIFYSSDWQPIGDKRELCSIIARITRIDLDILTGETSLEATTVAKRMSWAASRQTTRGEDMAYCLMGVFSVNMPMLYGEGKKRAFHRLQEEIMRYTNDQTLFAWIDPQASGEDTHGLLADGPEVFADSGDISLYSDWDGTTTFDMSNRGLRIELHLTRLADNVYAAALNLFSPFRGQDFLAIYLKQAEGDKHQYTRVKCAKLGSLDRKGSPERVYVRQSVDLTAALTVYPLHCFQMRECLVAKDEYKVINIMSQRFSDSENKHRPASTPQAREWIPARPTRFASTYKILRVERGLSAAILFRRKSDGESFALMLGSIKKVDVGFDVVELTSDTIQFGNQQSMEQHFNPKPPGTTFRTKHHRIKVDAEARVEASVKIYVVDITIEAIPKDEVLLEKSTKAAEAESEAASDSVKEGRNLWHKIGLHRD